MKGIDSTWSDLPDEPAVESIDERAGGVTTAPYTTGSRVEDQFGDLISSVAVDMPLPGTK